MAIGCWDNFTGHNWERYASVSAVIALASCFLFSIITWLAGYDVGTGVFTFFMGLLMLPLETQVLDCIQPCFSCKTFFNETLRLNQPAVKAVIYLLMSIGMFAIRVTPCVASGILMLVTVILLFFAQCNKIQDEADAARAGGRHKNLDDPIGRHNEI